MISQSMLPPESTGLLIGLAFCATAVFVLSLWRPHWGLVLTLAALYNPYFIYKFLLVNWQTGGRIRALGSAGFILAIVAALFVRGTAGGHVIRKVRTPVGRCLVLFALFLILGIVVGLWRENDARLLLADLFVIIEFYAFFLLTTFVALTRAEARKVVLAVVFVGALTNSALVAVYFFSPQQLTASFGKFGLDSAGVGVLSGVPRLMDFMGMVLLPMALGVFMYEGNRRTGIGLAVCAVPFSLSIVLSFFRAQWLGTAAALAFILWASRRTRLRAAFRVVSFAAFVIAGLLVFGAIGVGLGLFRTNLVDLVGARLANVIEGPSARARREEAADLWYAIRDSPLLGLGLGGAISTGAHSFLTGGEEFGLGGAHNYYLGLAAELGVPALIAGLMVLGVMFRRVLLILKCPGSGAHRGVALGAMASGISVAVNACFTPNFLHFPILPYLGTFLAAVFVVSEGQRYGSRYRGARNS